MSLFVTGEGASVTLCSSCLITSQRLPHISCEIPNCRAICDGLSPALNAARTAFTFPMLIEADTSCTRRCSAFSFDGGFLPRRCCSMRIAAESRSSSWSLSAFSACGKFFGRKCRCGSAVVDGESGVAETSSPFVVLERRSGEVDWIRLPMKRILRFRTVSCNQIARSGDADTWVTVLRHHERIGIPAYRLMSECFRKPAPDPCPFGFRSPPGEFPGRPGPKAGCPGKRFLRSRDRDRTPVERSCPPGLIKVEPRTFGMTE